SFAGDLADHSPGGEPCTRGVVSVEESPHDLPGRVETPNRLSTRRQDRSIGIHPQSAEGEGEPSSHSKGLERGPLDRGGPVALWHIQTCSALPVENGRIEGSIPVHGIV